MKIGLKIWMLPGNAFIRSPLIEANSTLH